MNRQWSKEEIWAWYQARPWVVGCNYVSAITMHNIEMFQEDLFDAVYPVVEKEMELMESLGINSVRMFLPFDIWYTDRESFLDRLGFYLTAFHKHGISFMPVIFNDCVGFSARPKEIKPPQKRTGWVKYDIGHHGGHKFDNPFIGDKVRKGWILWDEEEWQEVMLEYLSALMGRFGKDERILLWDLWNEPGNSNRGDSSIPYIKRTFEEAWKLNPMQPLTAGCWSYPGDFGINPDAELNPIEKLSVELSDIITFHQYENIDRVKAVVKGLEAYGRPLMNTEWLNRVLDNFFEDNIELYYSKKIGSYHWGLVAGKSQHFLPWDELRSNKELDLLRWQHDLFDTYHTPYDPAEIAALKRFTGKE